MNQQQSSTQSSQNPSNQTSGPTAGQTTQQPRVVSMTGGGRKNPWILITLLLVAGCLVLGIIAFRGGDNQLPADSRNVGGEQRNESPVQKSKKEVDEPIPTSRARIVGSGLVSRTEMPGVRVEVYATQQFTPVEVEAYRVESDREDSEGIPLTKPSIVASPQQYKELGKKVDENSKRIESMEQKIKEIGTDVGELTQRFDDMICTMQEYLSEKEKP